jgi:hypothetical protein
MLQIPYHGRLTRPLLFNYPVFQFYTKKGFFAVLRIVRKNIK